MTTITQHLWAALLGAVLLSSCSRPVAYFQRGTAEPFPTVASQSETVPVPASPVSAPLALKPSVQSEETETHHDLYVRKDNQVMAVSRVRERMNRIKALGVSTRTPQRLEERSTYRKMNRVERFMLKLINRKISRQLAPSHPEKTMINSPIKAIGGGILLIGGLLLLILGSGTVAFIGLILSLVGALGVIVGLIGI